MKPRFEFGEAVRVIRTVRNDGTFPAMARGEQLVRRGAVGYVREWGTFLQDNIIYQVHFLDNDRIVGCREHELIPAAAPWVDGAFQYGDWVSAAMILATDRHIRVQAGDVGQIMGVERDVRPMQFIVLFGGTLLQVPEHALEAIDRDDL
ncbi:MULTISPECIES: nitrogen fixation protein NifZ [Brenneria]|uniref:Nitrogen fixation protein NifZ n=1 Tax=Brenneria nigrifluens DSM 30175 = ATCC 13028 TaxID=1121120 RepID=A0A2U1UCM6_9GAMM|nr:MULTISPECIES: nitrogen fixation protein NifZ [Brenneria]EHD21380.1 NifZ family protein [Brenneria sp. EniD312]PWC19367.1 nitrogen fixation protein NifZ [Brenneria nigrifluens DSM 30175 = ATCC 13028]PWC20105.1 nitrogen fixation protein NifZ [Brenneria nigrifluens DSM 30175 = ATCC 13028]QCR04510.1 nitrogen fixation protein NifZ [Brenneria nigrifluens DSM 30175 = ATCC 13028]